MSKNMKDKEQGIARNMLTGKEKEQGMARNMLTGKGGDERERERGRKKKKKKSEPCLRDFRIRAVIHIGLSLIMG